MLYHCNPAFNEVCSAGQTMGNTGILAIQSCLLDTTLFFLNFLMGGHLDKYHGLENLRLVLLSAEQDGSGYKKDCIP